jgi:hypothetical protein
MTEPQLFEMVGRKQAQLEDVVSNYAKLVAICRGLKDGSIDMARFTVDAAGVWSLGPPIPKPESEPHPQLPPEQVKAA